MTRFVILSALDGKSSVKFLYNSGKKALAKALTFERASKVFSIRDGQTGELLSLEDLRKHAALEC